MFGSKDSPSTREAPRLSIIWIAADVGDGCQSHGLQLRLTLYIVVNVDIIRSHSYSVLTIASGHWFVYWSMSWQLLVRLPLNTLGPQMMDPDQFGSITDFPKATPSVKIHLVHNNFHYVMGKLAQKFTESIHAPQRMKPFHFWNFSLAILTSKYQLC